jgi:hypothetical protein
MNSRLTRRLTIALGLVLTIAALVAPSANAQAMQRIYSDHGVALIPSSTEPSSNLAPVSRDGTPMTIYSDHGIATIPPEQSEPNLACSSQGCTEIAPPQNGPTPIVNVSDEPSGFDWSKTGFIVSLTMVGLLLLGGGAFLAGKHNRRRRFAAA